jgi:hypothetical protein
MIINFRNSPKTIRSERTIRFKPRRPFCTNTGWGRELSYHHRTVLHININHKILYQTTLPAIWLHVRLQTQLLRWCHRLFGQERPRYQVRTPKASNMGRKSFENRQRVSNWKTKTTIRFILCLLSANHIHPLAKHMNLEALNATAATTWRSLSPTKSTLTTTTAKDTPIESTHQFCNSKFKLFA